MSVTRREIRASNQAAASSCRDARRPTNRSAESLLPLTRVRSPRPRTRVATRSSNDEPWLVKPSSVGQSRGAAWTSVLGDVCACVVIVPRSGSWPPIFRFFKILFSPREVREGVLSVVTSDGSPHFSSPRRCHSFRPNPRSPFDHLSVTLRRPDGATRWIASECREFRAIFGERTFRNEKGRDTRGPISSTNWRQVRPRLRHAEPSGTVYGRDSPVVPEGRSASDVYFSREPASENDTDKDVGLRETRRLGVTATRRMFRMRNANCRAPPEDERFIRTGDGHRSDGRLRLPASLLFLLLLLLLHILRYASWSFFALSSSSFLSLCLSFPFSLRILSSLSVCFSTCVLQPCLPPCLRPAATNAATTTTTTTATNGLD